MRASPSGTAGVSGVGVLSPVGAVSSVAGAASSTATGAASSAAGAASVSTGAGVSTAARVVVFQNQPITISVSQPQVNPMPARFAIFVKVGLPVLGEATLIPGFPGELCLTLGDPAVLLAFNGFAPIPGQLSAAPPAPFSTEVAGVPFSFDGFLQAVVEVGPGDLRVSNGIHLRVF